MFLFRKVTIFFVSKQTFTILIINYIRIDGEVGLNPLIAFS